jgi:hypothetical protein
MGHADMLFEKVLFFALVWEDILVFILDGTNFILFALLS